MAFVSVPKDLTKVKNKIILNLTKRQLICLGIAAAVGLPFYFLSRGLIGSSNAATGMCLLMLPAFLFAMYEKDGLPLEKVLKNVITVKLIRPPVRKYIFTDPFVNYKIRLKRVDRGYLTEHELQKILKKKFTCSRLEQVRDVFIFACFTGLAYIDVRNLTKENIRISFDDKPWIMTARQKTDTAVNVPLLKVPQAILKKYEGKLPNGLLLPVLSNQKLNSYLKEIGDLCGISKNITFHLARHTFATTMTLAKGVPIESVSKMLGHTNIQTTQIYARITSDKISRDMQALSGKLDEIEKIALKA